MTTHTVRHRPRGNDHDQQDLFMTDTTPTTGLPGRHPGSDDGTPGAKDHIDEATGAVQAKASDAADATKDKAADLTDQAQGKAQDAAARAKEQIRAQLDQRSTQAGERATATAGDLRSISQHLKEQGNDAPAKLADDAAMQIEKAGSYLQRTDGRTLLSDVEDFARRNPWAAGLGGLAVGFAASRALKASSTDRRSTPADDSPRPAPSLPSPVPTPVADAASDERAPASGYPSPTGTPANPLAP